MLQAAFVTIGIKIHFFPSFRFNKIQTVKAAIITCEGLTLNYSEAHQGRSEYEF